MTEEGADTTNRDARIDALVSALDARIAAQLDAVLHHASFLQLESTWRGVWEFVSRLRPEHGVVVELLNVNRGDLIADFDDAPDVPRSGLYKQAHYCDNWGGVPFTAILGLDALGDDNDALRLARLCSEVAKAISAPFITGCAPALLRCLADPEARHHATREAWLSLRHEPSARFIAAVVTRWLVRDAHTVRTDAFVYRETWTSDDTRPWASGALLVARLLAESFAETRLPVRLTGQELDGLPATPSGEAELSPALRPQHIAAVAAEGLIAFEAASRPGAVVCREAPTLLHPAAQVRAELSADDRALHGTLPAALFVGRMLTYLRSVRVNALDNNLDAATLQSALREVLERLPECGLPTEKVSTPTAERPASRFLCRSRRMLRNHSLDVERIGHELELRLRFQPNWSLDGRFATFVGDARVYDEGSTSTTSNEPEKDHWDSRTDPPMTRAQELTWRIRVIQAISTPPEYAIEMLGRFAELAPHVREHMGVSDEMFERGMLGLGRYGMPVAFHYLPVAERDRLARTGHAAFEVTRAFEPDLDEATGDHLIECGAEEAQRAVLRRKPTKKRLERASKSAWPVVRADVAAASDDSALISRLARDPDQVVRLAVARRSDTPDDALALLLFDDEVLVRRWAARHLGPRPGAGPVLDRAASDPDERVRALVARYAASEESALRLLDDELPAIRRAAAREGALSSATLHSLVHDADEGVRFALAERNDASPELLDQLARDPSVDVREAVADHRATSTSTLLRLAADEAPSVREVVALRPKLDETVLEVLRDAPDEVVAARLRER